MPEKVKRNSISKMTRESLSSLRKTFSKFTKKVKADNDGNSLEVAGKKFENYKELINFAKQEMAKAKEKYVKKQQEYAENAKKKFDECRQLLNDKEETIKFNNQFGHDSDELLIYFCSVRFIKGEEFGLKDYDDDEKHNEEDFKLLCKSTGYRNCVSMSTPNTSSILNKYRFRSDKSKRETITSSQVTFIVCYLPIVMVSYEKDVKKTDEGFKKLFGKMDKYVEEKLKIREQWSKKPQKLRERESILGNGSKYFIKKAWSKKPRYPISSLKDRTKVTGIRQRLIGRKKSVEEKMAKEAAEKLKQQEERQKEFEKMQQSRTSTSSSRRPKLVGRRTTTKTS